jgi:hypothetical protein
MSRTIVSLISDQTIPNYVFIKEMFKDGDKLMMIISKDDKIISKEKYIEQVLQPATNPTKIILEQKGDEENWHAMKSQIEPYLSDDEEYIVNITCGTKLMVLAIENIFSKYNSKFYYIPFPKNKIIELYSPHVQDIKYRVSVNEYMALYGLPISSSPITQSKEYTNDFFNLYTNQNLSNHDYDILEHLREYRNTKKINIQDTETRTNAPKKPRIEGLSSFLNFTSFPLKNMNEMTKYEIRYITGGWFEEYVYNLIKEKINPTDIQLGVLIQQTQNTNMNDLDVVFTLGNKLFVIECKTGVGQHSLFNQIVYKSCALNESLLGLAGYSYICSLNNSEEKLKNIAKNMKITYCDKSVFTNIEMNEKWLNSIKYIAHE